MHNYKKHLILSNSKIKEALALLNNLAADAILFVTDADNKLLGSLTDGDIRRGFLNGLMLEDVVDKFIQPNPKYIRKGDYNIEQVISFREKNIRIIPILDGKDRVINIVNFRSFKSFLPIDAVIMAGGKGQRLRPLTNDTPKPLLKIGGKPIIEHKVDRLINYGVDDFWISLGYLGDQIEDYFQDGSNKNVCFGYVNETEPMGTIGAVSQIDNFKHDHILVSNSDLLTNLDYEDFFLDFIKSDADLSVVTIPYTVNVPYAVLQQQDDRIVSFVEKPTYTYYSNGGIYLMKREVVDLIPNGEFYNATDLIQLLIDKGMKVTSYPQRGYWLDIGKPDDFKKAQEDIKHLKL